jgi:hypothetical protein
MNYKSEINDCIDLKPESCGSVPVKRFVSKSSALIFESLATNSIIKTSTCLYNCSNLHSDDGTDPVKLFKFKLNEERLANSP